MSDLSGSARVSRAGDGAIAIADFSSEIHFNKPRKHAAKAYFGEAPKPAREARALPRWD